MSDDLPAEVVAHLDRLREGYLSSLPDRAEQLDRFISSAAEAGWPEARRLELKTRVHKLAGSLGLYGVTQAQAEAERLDRCMEHDDYDPTHLGADLGRLLMLMKKGL